MPPPSRLLIATSSLNRLVKEERSYHKELEQQEASITKLEQQGPGDEDENAEYILKQQVRSLTINYNTFEREKKLCSKGFDCLYIIYHKRNLSGLDLANLCI